MRPNDHALREFTHVQSSPVIDMGGHGLKLFSAEHRLNWKLEYLADAHGQIQAGGVIASFQGANGLRIHINPSSQLCTGHVSFCT